MDKNSLSNLINNFKYDFPASIVVFFVALPLCLGIALASGAPLFSGIIAGILGGIVVGMLSGSPLGVSGPAAGLVTVVLTSMTELHHSWAAFQLVVLIAGMFQLILGLCRAGIIVKFFPSSVIKGMLSGIGLIIMLKQIPYGLGYFGGYEAYAGMQEIEEKNLFSRLYYLTNLMHIGPIIITAISITMLVFWEQILHHKNAFFRIVQGPFAVVLAGIFITWLSQAGLFELKLMDIHKVALPVPVSFTAFIHLIQFPDFSQLTNINIYSIAFTLTIIASIETLLTVDATDKIDPYKRKTSTNRELKAQGVGNILAGFLGGLPITQVIVRSAANVSFGARTKTSTILHGILLLISILTIPKLLNMIPLASLASILFIIGYKLARPAIFIQMFKLGIEEFVPFIATIIGIVLTDLLIGICIGIATVFLITFMIYIKNPSQLMYFVKTKLKGQSTVHQAPQD